VQRLWYVVLEPPVGAELPPVAAEPPVGVVVDVELGEDPPVGAELPPAFPVLVGVVAADDVDDNVPLVSLDELVSLDALVSPDELEFESVVSPVVPVSGEVVPVDAPGEFSSWARLADAVGSTRLGIVRGTESETLAPPQAVRTSPPRSAPSNAAGRASLTGIVSLRLGPCGARMSGSR
jgi:hypothetical protein